ncbi:hypothetical protein SLEP1_g21056 [Rubroshorea leprosula]|uniref:Protein kinase domain-containing protein n=1 Tax=Rubroshorea leprosula TaxID=152421 RepID=A0AAV5JDY0_9ROSI|nr:hypothetical protein SLEP1_g21056 [Rubroshorea leprosula]
MKKNRKIRKKRSLRNCNLQGSIPDLSGIPNLGYLELSSNKLSGPLPTNKLFENITTMDLENNLLVNISGSSYLPPNVTLWLKGNPICSSGSFVQFCKSQTKNEIRISTATNSTTAECKPQSCPYEYSPTSPLNCFCAEPLLIGFRLKSPGFSDFIPYKKMFEEYLTQSLSLSIYQLYIYSFAWLEGSQVEMYLKLYPIYDNTTNNHLFNPSDVRQIRSMFTGVRIPLSGIFGCYELINFTFPDVFKDESSPSLSTGVSKGALASIILGTFAGAVTLSAIISLIIFRRRLRGYHAVLKRRQSSRALLKIDGVKSFTYGELVLATNNFDIFTQIGQGGYGKVYRGTLADGTIVAIKRAQQGSLQGEKEFLTEIQLLSRLHHRNLVSLVGYCDQEGEQMLVYEYMSNGTLQDHLSGKIKEPLSFTRRLRIALGSSKGILYLHTEVDPPIFHRDIKASNILLDSKLVAKVADFGLSRLAPVPGIEGAAPAYVSTIVKGTPVSVLLD